MKTKTINITTLSNMYGVCYNTMRKMLNEIPELELKKGQRILTPKQLMIIYNHFGTPSTK